MHVFTSQPPTRQTLNALTASRGRGRRQKPGKSASSALGGVREGPSEATASLPSDRL